MDTTELRHPDVIKARWQIDNSHMVAVPDYITTRSLPELCSQVQAIADSKKVRTDRPPMGTISFRYEADPHGIITTVHTYFINKHGKQTRFMRLRRAAD